MDSNHTDELVRKFKEEKVILFLGPYFAESNGYPGYIAALENIIDGYLLENKNNDSSNIDLWLKQKDYLRVSEWCSRGLQKTKNFEFFEQTISQIYKRTRSIGILYHLAVSLQVSAIVTPNLDNVLAHSFSEKSVLSHSWTNGNGALKTLKNKKIHILYELGVADKPESILLANSKYADVIKQNCWKEYYKTVFSEYIPLFIGFEPNDPLFQNWIEFCNNNVSQPKPWYAFFVPNHDSSFQISDNLRVIPCDAPIDDKIDTSKKVVFYQSFLTDIIELTIGHGKAYSLLSNNAASDWYKLDEDLIKNERQKSCPDFFYHGGKPGWKIIVDDLDARRDLESEIKSFLRVQELRSALLTAPAGEGKSTFAYRIAYDFWRNEGFDIFWVDNPYRFPQNLVNRLQKYKDKDVLVVVNRAQSLSDIHLRIKQWKKNSYVRLRILLIGRTHEIKQGVLRLSKIKRELPYKEFKLSWISPTEAERVVSKLRRHDQLGVILKNLPLSRQAEYFYNTGKGDLLATLLQCIDGDDLSKTVASVCKNVSALPDGDFMLKAYSIVAALNRWKIECSTRLFLQTVGIKKDDIYARLLEKLPGELDLNVYRQFVETRHTAIAKAACKFLFDTESSLVDEMEIYKNILEAVGELGESFENKLSTIIPIRFKENNEIGKARILFQEATKTNSSNAPSWQAWAIMEKEQGDIVRARELFQKAINVDSSNAPSWQAWAIMEKEQGDIVRARELFQKAINVDSSNAPSWRAWISMELETGNLSEVEQLTKDACNAGIEEEELSIPERKKPVSEDDKIKEKDFGLKEEVASWPFTQRWVTDNLDFGDMRIIAYLLAGLATRLNMAVMLVEIRNNMPELLHPVNRTLFYPKFCENLFKEQKLIDWNEHPCKKDMRKRALEIYKEFEENKQDIKPIIKECHLGFRSIYYPIVIDSVMLGFFIIGKLGQPTIKEIMPWISKRKELIDELRRNPEYCEMDCLKEAEESLNKLISDHDKNTGWTKKKLEYFFNNKALRGLSRVKEVVEIIHRDKRYEKESEFFASLNKDLVLPSSRKDAKVDLRPLLRNALTKLKQYLNAAFVGLFLGMEPRDRYLPLVGIALNNRENSDPLQIYLDKKKAGIPDEVLSDSAWQFERFKQDVLEKAIKGNDMNLIKDISLVVAFSHLGHIGVLMIGPLKEKGTKSQLTYLKRFCFGLGLQATGLYLLGEYSSKRETELLGYSLFVHSLRSSAHLDINILKFLKRFVDKKETNWSRAIEAVDDLSESNKFMGQQIRESLETSSGMSVIQAILNQSNSHESSILTNTPLLLTPLVKNIIERHLPKAKVKQIKLTLDKNRLRGVSLQVSSFFLEKMIAVFIDNAILYGREGCCVVINWHKTDDNFIRLEVAGTGQRITMERQENLWEFGQRKKQKDISVHGLHIIKKAAEAWKGSAGNRSRECDFFEKNFQEHTFWFTFPLKP
ncbi:MAG: SIR2 family protein [Deltaproteobacteria bacterium]|nr:SIR2 family protein [Deltaproteobacteria bacterium]